MGTGLEVVAIVAAVSAVAGAGVSAYGQYQAGKTQSAIASINARQQEANARAQSLSLQAQAALKEQEAQANFQLRSAEAAARLNNARAIEQQVTAQDQINAQNLAKRRQEYARMQSQQRSLIAASGVIESSGTPLDLLAETAARIQQDQQEIHYTNELQRRTLFSEAAQERLGGKLAQAGATLDRDSTLAAVSLQQTAAEGVRLSGMRESQITRLTGDAAKTASYYNVGSTLLSGVSGAAGFAANYFKPKTYKIS
jgi:hypothetical protein